MLSILRIAAVAVLLTGAAVPTRAAQSYDNCIGFIDSLPATISTQGTWCLRKDLSTAMASGNAITIASNNITIDCNDFKLGGLAAGAGTSTTGIFALDRSNATVRHCNIRGFAVGIYFQGSTGGHVVEDNRFDGNTYMGVQVHGDGSVLRGNRITDTGGSVISADAYGIVAWYAVDVLDNTISGVLSNPNAGDSSAVGIYTFDNPNGSISGNRVRGLVWHGTGLATGILNESSGRISVRGNDLSGNGGTGLVCSNSNGSARDNSFNGFVIAIDTCADSGGNAVIP